MSTTSKNALVKDVSADELQAALALLRASQQKDAVTQAKDEIASDLTPVIAKVLSVQPVKPSSKAESSWVGAVMGGLRVEIEGRTYTVQVTVKDDEASALRKAGA